MNSRFLLTALLPLALAACKAEPTWESGFLDLPAPMVEDPTVPFHRAWYADDLDWSRYTQVLVKPVNTRFLRSARGFDEWTVEFGREESVHRLARYMREQFVQAFREDPEHLFRPVPHQDGNTLVVEAALVELTPTKAFFNAVAKAAVSFSWHKGAVAMEVRFRDGGTGEIIAAFIDREEGKHAVFTLDDLVWYGHAEDVVGDWSNQIVEVIKKSPDETVEDSWTIKLIPW